MTPINEFQDHFKKYKTILFTEFLEFICRIADFKFRGLNMEKYTLAEKIVLLLNIIFELFSRKRKELRTEGNEG